MKRERKKKSSGSMKAGRELKTLDEIEREAKTRPEEAYVTTGEVSRLLGGVMSRSTVVRMFDQGDFEGRFDPFTGRREIKWRAVEWLKRKGFIVDTIEIVEKRHEEIRTNLQENKEETQRAHMPKLTREK